ncbi:MAG TPA: hypothetical protein VGF77_06065 [Allosphingosinicella sp.]|jgi:hypothetical protein
MRNPRLGSVYITPELDRNIVLQFIGRNKIIGSIARVARVLGGYESICDGMCTLFVIGFPFRAAIADKYLEFSGECPIQDEMRDLKFRFPNYRIGSTEIVSWSIIENDKQVIKSSLNHDEYNYPLAYTINIKKLEELVISNWDGKTPIP